MARRSTTSWASSVGAPCTWQRKPSSAYLSARTTPDFASRRLARTSWVLLPMDETMPIPVTTTRLMIASSAFSGAPRWKAPRSGPGPARLRHFILLEQAHFQVERPVDHRVVGGQPAVRNAEHQFRPHHALHVDAVDDLLDVRKNLAGELELAKPERPAPPRRPQPAEEEAQHLPQRIDAEAAGHHRVALEMTGEKPEVRLQFEHRPNHAFAVLAALFGDLRNAVEHEHRRQWQLRPVDEQLTATAREQVLVFEARTPLSHARSVPKGTDPCRCDSLTYATQRAKFPPSTAPCAVLYPLLGAVAKELQKRANLDIISFVTIIRSRGPPCRSSVPLCSRPSCRRAATALPEPCAPS